MNDRPYKETLNDIDWLYIEDASQGNLSSKGRKIQLSELKQKVGGSIPVTGTDDEIVMVDGGNATTNSKLKISGSDVYFDGQYFTSSPTSMRMKIHKDTQLPSATSAVFNLHSLVAGQGAYFETYVFCRQGSSNTLITAGYSISADRYVSSQIQGTDTQLFPPSTGTFTHTLVGDTIRMSISGLPNANQWRIRVVSYIYLNHA